MSAGVCTGTPAARPRCDAWERPELPIATATLANGLRVAFAEDHTVPLVLLSWTSDAGIASDPPGLEGLASLTPFLLREGTAHRSAEQITQELEELGADVTAGSDWDSAFLNLGLLSSDFAPGVELLLDMTCAPQFPPASLARVRHRRLAELDRRRRDPRTLATDAFAGVLFGPTGYGRLPLGTPSTVQRIDGAHLVTFHDAHYRPASSYLVVAGSFDRDAAVDLLGSFELPQPLSTNVPRPLVSSRMTPAGGVVIVDVAFAAHAEIRVGHAGVPRDSEDLPALDMLSSILGSGPSSRLAERLRHQAGLTYHVRSRFLARRFGGVFVVETSVAAESAGAAVAAIRGEIERLCDELAPADDVEEARRRLLGAELRRQQDLVATGATLGTAALYGDPVRDLERRRHAMAMVEPVALREVARRSLRPENLLTVAVGPADVLRSQFPSGEAEIHARTLDTTS